MVGQTFDSINPEEYETRYERIPREGYSRDHWRSLVVARISKYCQGKTVLDLGCGGGAYTRLIAEYTERVLGVDSSKVMLSYAKNNYNNLNLVLADAHHIPLEPASVDTAVCIGLFEYIERAVVLQELGKILKSDGICIIQCPNKYSICRMPDKVACRLRGREHFCKEPSYREMLGLFRQNGFEVIESIMDDGLIWLPDFLDRFCGKRIYTLLANFFRILGRNPFSNVMLFVVRSTKR